MNHELNEAWGRGSRFGFAQIAPNQVYWYALCDQRSGYQDGHEFDWLKCFENYHPVIHRLIAHTSADNISRKVIADLKPLSSWVCQRICLLGDAAHAITPNLGQGACQAIEDAYVLNHCLQLNMDVVETFKHYETLRMKKVKKIAHMSWSLGKVAHLHHPLLLLLRNISMRMMPARLARWQSEKIFHLSV